MSGQIPSEVRQFITRHIVSVEEMEVLLLLESERERDWNAAEINARLRSQESSIEKWLGILEAMRLVRKQNDRFRFGPATPELAQQVTALHATYRVQRIRVIECIFSKSNEDVLSFARAFDIRRRP